MTNAPDPFTPADCDLRGYDYMPLYGHRLFSSTFDAKATDAEFRAAMRLWWTAYAEQCPSASLPDDDDVLCKSAGFGRDLKAWRKVKERALHGFVKCSDGRYYHAGLAEEAVRTYALRLKDDSKRAADRERLQRWREDKKKRGSSGGGNAGGNAGGNDDETRFTQRTSQVETPNVAVEEKGKEEKKEGTPLPPKGAASDADPAFSAFWAGYPRKDAKGDARKAWPRALVKATSAQILAGLSQYRFREEMRFVPLPATWLNGERWLHSGELPSSSKPDAFAWIDNLGASPTFDLDLTADDNSAFDTTH